MSASQPYFRPGLNCGKVASVQREHYEHKHCRDRSSKLNPIINVQKIIFITTSLLSRISRQFLGKPCPVKILVKSFELTKMLVKGQQTVLQ